MIALHPLLSCHHGIVLSCHHVKFIIKLHSTIVLSCFPSDLIIFASVPLLNIKEWERKGEERESLSESALQCHSESICTSLLLLVQLHFGTTFCNYCFHVHSPSMPFRVNLHFCPLCTSATSTFAAFWYIHLVLHFATTFYNPILLCYCF